MTTWIILLLAAAALRQLGHAGPIGLFLHVPFPPRDVWETLPWHREVIDALLACDLIGFHTRRWADNFLAAAPHGVAGLRRVGDRLVRVGRATTVGVFPIGIEPAGCRPPPAGDPADDLDGLRALLAGRKLVLGVDRLDYSKGIPERLEAFRRLLQLFPAWRSAGVVRAGVGAVARRGPRVRRAAAARRGAGRAHQRRVRRGRLGAGALPVPLVPAGGAGAPVPSGRGRHGDAAERRHEPGGQGICRGPEPRRSRRAGPVAFRRGRRADWRLWGQK